MRKYIVLLVLCLACGAQAQKNYKQLLQYLPGYTDREAIYKLEEYRRQNPQDAHPYYLLGNYYYRLQKEEHALVNYAEKMLCLYNTRLYYGNCKVYVLQDDVKQEWYEETAIGGKVTDGSIMVYLDEHIRECEEQEAKVTALYEAYHRLVTDYDSCCRYFRAYNDQYSRLKEAHMQYKAEDDTIVSRLSTKADQLNGDIETYLKALKECPIEGYEPKFRYHPIDYYRLDGLIETDFLQNDVVLWDYKAWTEAFYRAQSEITLLDRDIEAEQQRLLARMASPGADGLLKAEATANRLLVNRINKYDEGSPIAGFLKIEQRIVELATLEKRILRDSVREDDWSGMVQLAYRMHVTAEAVRTESAQLGVALSKATIEQKYPAFVRKYTPKNKVKELAAQAARMEKDVQRYLSEVAADNSQLSRMVQISETMMAELGEGLIVYRKGTIE